MRDLINKALSAKRESKYVEFKSEVDFEQPHTWCEVIKDIVAMANTGGGIVLIGVDNRGTATGHEPSQVLELDPAVVCDKIRKYTGVDFSEFELLQLEKEGQKLAAILVNAVPIPLVFSRPGTYTLDEKKHKTAFSAGTVYFRHGAKSEPGSTDDLRKAIERQLESIRRSWLKGVRKVVQSPPGSKVYTFPADIEVRESTSADARAIRIVDDPDAPAYRKLDYDITHPYRQTEVIKEVNKALTGKAKINSYDIQSVKAVYEIAEDDSMCHYRKFSSSPQYSREFVDWLISSFEKNNSFFEEVRRDAYERRHS